MEGDRLTEDEAAVVFRRAAELELAEQGSPPATLDVRSVEEIGRQAGLSSTAIRRAVAELRAGSLALAPAPARPPGLVAAAERRVPAAPARVTAEVDRFCRRQLFEVRRRVGARTAWAPRKGLAAQLRRTFDVGGRLRLDDVDRLTVTVVELPDGAGTHVSLEADLDSLRRGLGRGLVAVPAGIGVAGTATVAALAGLDPVVLAAGAGGAALTAGGWATARAVLHRTRASVEETLAGFLDTLAPPP